MRELRILSKQLRLFFCCLVLALSITLTYTTAPMADATHQVVIGMPFTGQWAYNTFVSPPYTDSNSSHPSVHAAPGGGDWATDLYATEGTAVKLEVGYAMGGSVSYSWGSSSTSCGQSTKINVFVGGISVGWLYFAHLNNAVTSGPITNGMTLGTVHDWGGCNPGPHVHIEFRNTTNYSCYVDNGNPGVTLTLGDNLGVLGSTNTGAKQACSSIPAPSPGPSYTSPDNQGYKVEGDFNGDGYGDIVAFSVGSDGHTYNVWEYNGSTSGLSTPTYQMTLGPTVGGWDFAKSKPVTTDVNGDGKTDLVIFHQASDDSIDRHVFLGTSSGIGAESMSMAVRQNASSGWLWSRLKVAGAGDFNGDGYGDVLIFSKNSDLESFNVYEYNGSTSGLSTPTYQMQLGPSSGGWYYSKTKQVTTDVTGDGKTDLVIFHKASDDSIDRHVFPGTTSGVGSEDTSMAVRQNASSGWLWSRLKVAGAGDFNDDGYGDVTTLSVGSDGETFNVYVYNGSTSGLSTPTYQMQLGPSSGGWNFTLSKPTTTDVDGDGKMDLVIFHRASDGSIDRHVFLGTSSGIGAENMSMAVRQNASSGWLWDRFYVA